MLAAGSLVSRWLASADCILPDRAGVRVWFQPVRQFRRRSGSRPTLISNINRFNLAWGRGCALRTSDDKSSRAGNVMLVPRHHRMTLHFDFTWFWAAPEAAQQQKWSNNRFYLAAWVEFDPRQLVAGQELRWKSPAPFLTLIRMKMADFRIPPSIHSPVHPSIVCSYVYCGCDAELWQTSLFWWMAQLWLTAS